MAIFDSIKGGAMQLLTKSAGSVSGLLNPKNARMSISGLFPGGANSLEKAASNINFGGGSGSSSRPEDDWRVRISLSPQNKIFYNDASNTLMAPLANTNGVVFPHTPQINVSHSAVYNSALPTHSNYASQFYQASEVNDITISGDFTVQTVEEGQYLLASIYFFRSATKMFFGADKAGNISGQPPPMVYLDGYGAHYFPHVQCVITQFTHTLPNEVDYINVPITSSEVIEVDTPEAGPNSAVDVATNSITGPNGETYVPSILQSANPTRKQTQLKTTTKTTRLPTNSSISITLRPVYSRNSVHSKFNLDDFAAGKLIGGNGGFI